MSNVCLETVASYYLPCFSNSLKLYDQVFNIVYSNSYCNASENPVLPGAQTLLALCRLSQMYLSLTVGSLLQIVCGLLYA